MSELCQDILRCDPQDLRQAMSIHTRKITDSCRDKDCIEDLRVYLSKGSQALLDSCAGARVRCAELLYTYIDVEPVAFDGLAVFSKRAVICGEDSRAHIYRSDTRFCAPDGASRYSANRPTAVVEVLDPMILSSKVREVCECRCNEDALQIPNAIADCCDDELVRSGERRRLFVTLGQFSIIRLERDAQLIVPVLDYAIPTKECCDAAGCAEDP